MNQGGILIVEDEFVVAESIRSELESMNYKVAGLVSSGEEALESARRSKPELALMDIKLRGDMDGVETAVQLRRRLNVPVLFLTAFADEKILERAKLAEPLGYLIKPFERRGLRAAIEMACYKAKMERSLKESESRFRSMFEHAPVAYLALDESDRCLDFNSELCGLLSCSPEDLAGRRFVDFWPLDEQRHYEERFTRLKRDERFQTELKLAPADGAPLIVLLEGSIQRNIDGEFIRMHCILHNITERKRIEEERNRAEQDLWTQYELQRVLLSAIPAYVYIKDTNSVYMVGNKRFSELSGTPENEIPGKTDYDFFSETDADSFRKNDAEIIASGQARLDYEMKGMDGEGNPIWFSTSKCPYHDPSGEIAGLVGICINITDRKRAEEERLQFEQQLQQAQKAESLARMAGAVAHHFNNRLSVVIGYLDLALTDAQQEHVRRKWIGKAMKSSQQAAELSRLMLTYLGYTAGNRESIDLAETIRETIPLLMAGTPKAVHLKVDLPRKGPTILADPADITHILNSLNANAREAIGERAGEIAVTLQVMDVQDIPALSFLPLDWEPEAESYACISVSDTGCGMDSPTREKIFDPFFSTKFTGRGLGLPVVLGLMRAYEGAIAVESRPGQGARFKVFLPLPAQ